MQTANDPYKPTRRAHSWAWREVNPIMPLGEVCLEDDTEKTKVGDGVTPWRKLPYHVPADDTAPGIIIETNKEPLTGVKIDEDGLKAYNDVGELTAELDGNTGRLTATGEVNTGLPTESRVRMVDSQDTDATVGAIEFYTALPAEVSIGKIENRYDSFYDQHMMTVEPSTAHSTGQKPYLSLQSTDENSPGPFPLHYVTLFGAQMSLGGDVSDTSTVLDLNAYNVNVLGEFVNGDVGTGTFRDSIHKSGNRSATPNGSGEITVTHDWGSTNYTFIATPQTTNRILNAANKYDNTTKVVVRDETGALVTSGTVVFEWACLGKRS